MQKLGWGSSRPLAWGRKTRRKERSGGDGVEGRKGGSKGGEKKRKERKEVKRGKAHVSRPRGRAVTDSFSSVPEPSSKDKSWLGSWPKNPRGGGGGWELESHDP